MPIELVTAIAENGVRSFSIDGTTVPFSPVVVRVFRLRALRETSGGSSIEWLSSALGLTEDTIRRVAEDVNAFPHAHVHNVRFVEMEGSEMLCADVEGTVPGLPIGMLSGRETERVFIEFVAAASRVSGRYHPTLLILDGCPAILFKRIFEFYKHHFLDPENQFQTIMCVPSRDLDLEEVRWNGWEVVPLLGKRPNVTLTQDPRVGKPA